MINRHSSYQPDSARISFFRSLRGKLILLFLAISLIPSITVGLLTYTQAQNALKAEVINKLIAVRDIKAKRIENYFKASLDDVNVLSQNPFTVAAIRAFEKAIHTDMKVFSTDELGVMNNHYRPQYLGKPDLLSADNDSAYSVAHAQYHPMFKAFKEIYGYSDIFIVEPHSANILYSVVKEDDFGTSLEKGPYADTNIGQVFRKSVIATRHFTKLEDFAYYEPSKKAASFIASPIFDGTKLMGVLIFQLPTDRINAIMQEHTGLGATGETILICSDDFFLRSDSRFYEESTLLKRKVDTEATRASAAGETGVKTIIDYRGKPTIIAHTPLNISGVRWSLDAKIDQAEAFAAAQQMLLLMLIIISIGTVIVLGFALFFSNSIAKPIQAMTDIACRLADGDMNLTVEVKNQDEIGVMAHAFRQMIANLRLVIEDIVQISQGLAQGNLQVTPKTEYKGDFLIIKNTLEMTLSELRRVIEDIVQVSQGLAEGNLYVTHQAEYRGDFIQIKNALEMAFSGRRQVFEDIVRVSQELAQGNLRVTHQAEYRGAFIQIKNAQETALSNLWQVIEDIVQVSQGLAEGRLDVRPRGEYQGDFVQIKHVLERASAKLAETTRKNATQDWLKTGQTELNERMRGEQTLIVLTQNILNYLAAYLNIQVGVFFLVQKDRLKLMSSYAYKQRHRNDNEFKLGDGLIGQAALEQKSILFTQVPEEYINLSINSGLGESPPHDIFVLPLIYEQQVLGVLELATSRHFTATEIEWLERVADPIAISLNSAQSRLRMQALLEESQQLTLSLKTQQHELIKSEERIQAIVDTVIDAIITIDDLGIIESFNPAAERIFGYVWSDVVGQNINMLMPEPHRSQHDQYLRNYLRTGNAKIIGNVREVVGQRQDGSIFPVEVSIAEMQIGEQRLFTGIVRDITKRKEAEKALQQQQQELQLSNEELRNQSEELQVQQEELSHSNEELEERTKELEQQKDKIHQKNVALENNQMEMEKAKTALETKANELELANRYKSEFLANMSHELRTPLNSLLILAQLLTENKTGNLTEKQVEYARTVHSAGTDLLMLINDILDLSKVEAGKMEVHVEELSLADLVESVAQKFSPVADKNGLAFQITMAEDLPQVFCTDAQRLQQILNNLLSNAFKFTSQGEIKLDIRKSGSQPLISLTDQALASVAPQSFFAISVTDTGIGIPTEKQPVVFDAFQQVDGTTSRRYGGTGLGLSISRQLAKLLGGELKLESEEGKGCTFTLYLPELPTKTSVPLPSGIKPSGGVPAAKASIPPPLEVEAKASIPPSSEVEPSDDRNTLQPEDKSILIIEDDRHFLHILMELAREKNFKCIVAEDGQTGLQLAQEYQPNAIILDVGLPELNGWTVMERLKDNPDTRHIPVHFISASELDMDAKKMGAIGYLLKPVSMAELGEAFNSIEQFIAQTLKNLLIVVDNEQRQQKFQALVGDGEVNLTVAMNQTDAIHHLHTAPFDCIILDVDVEQQTGLQFIQPLQQEDKLAQIPVIIYAERELTAPEEKILQACEANLTIKAVKSPARLLDETTLFLHQLEAKLPKDKRQMLQMVHDKETILRHKKVLIVDDDVRNTFALMTFLEGKDMEVIIAETGKEALAQLDKHSDTSIVLMDIMMPEMDGYEAMREIRKQARYYQLPIIALTAKAMKSDKAKCIEAGANDYLSKPVDTDKLISLMRVWLYR